MATTSKLLDPSEPKDPNPFLLQLTDDDSFVPDTFRVRGASDKSWAQPERFAPPENQPIRELQVFDFYFFQLGLTRHLRDRETNRQTVSEWAYLWKIQGLPEQLELQSVVPFKMSGGWRIAAQREKERGFLADSSQRWGPVASGRPKSQLGQVFWHRGF